MTCRVPVEGKSSVCVICMKYRIIVLISIIISLVFLQTHHTRTHTLAHAHTSAHARAQAHTHTAVAVQVIAVLWVVAPNRGGVNAPFRRFRRRSMAGRRSIQIKLALATRFHRGFGCFPRIKKTARPNWDANSWQDVLSDDTNSLRHLPRAWLATCSLRTTTDRHTENNSVHVFMSNYEKEVPPDR